MEYKNSFPFFVVGILLRVGCLAFLPSVIIQSISHAANEDWNRLKEEATLFLNPSVVNASAAITQPPLFLMMWKIFGFAFYESTVLPLLEFAGLAVFLLLDFAMAKYRSMQNSCSLFPMSALVFALNPFSVFSFGSHSVGIVSGIINVLIFISLARDKPCVASILCAIGCYISIYPGYLMLAVLSQCRTKKSLLQSIAMFVFFLTGLLLTTYFVEHNWDFLKHSYLSNIYALDTTPNLGIFWYMYVEMFSHFNVFFVWTMQLIIFCTCFALFLRFYDDPLFLALLLTMTTGVLKPYNSMSEFGCSLAIAMQWRHLFKYFRNVLVLGVMVTVALILAPLFFFTWLHTSTSNANFYFSASLMVGVVRVQLISQLASAYLRGQFHKKFGSNPRLSTGAKVVPCIRS
uniref:Na_H_Exchanger domain-containing protein n=2 Tax=Mesocestoides corti TaxID=53468 RepID=A0A5K3EKW2_MESCO